MKRRGFLTALAGLFAGGLLTGLTKQTTATAAQGAQGGYYTQAIQSWGAPEIVTHVGADHLHAITIQNLNQSTANNRATLTELRRSLSKFNANIRRASL